MTLHPCFQPASPQLPIPTPLHIVQNELAHQFRLNHIPLRRSIKTPNIIIIAIITNRLKGSRSHRNHKRPHAITLDLSPCLCFCLSVCLSVWLCLSLHLSLSLSLLLSPSLPPLSLAPSANTIPRNHSPWRPRRSAPYPLSPPPPPGILYRQESPRQGEMIHLPR